MKLSDFKTEELTPVDGVYRIQVIWPGLLRGNFEINGRKRRRSEICTIFHGRSLAEVRMNASEAIDSALAAHITAEIGVRNRVRGLRRWHQKRAS